MGIAHELRGGKKTMKTQCKNSSSFNLVLGCRFSIGHILFYCYPSVEISACSLLAFRDCLHMWSTWSTVKLHPILLQMLKQGVGGG